MARPGTFQKGHKFAQGARAQQRHAGLTQRLISELNRVARKELQVTKRGQLTNADVIIQKIVEKAAADPTFPGVDFMFDRTEGKAKQAIDLTGEVEVKEIRRVIVDSNQKR